MYSITVVSGIKDTNNESNYTPEAVNVLILMKLLAVSKILIMKANSQQT